MHKEDTYITVVTYKEKGRWKNISFGRSFNESIICFTNEQEAETSIAEINKYRGWTAKSYQSYFQKQLRHTQNNEEQQNATENNTKSCRPSTAEKAGLNRLNKEDTHQLKEEIRTLAIQREWPGNTGNQSRIEEKEKIKNKTRRSKIIKNALKHFKIFHQNIKGVKSKVDSNRNSTWYKSNIVCKLRHIS